MSDVLVVYGTKTGCTAGIAEQIGAILVEAGLTADVHSVEKAPGPSGYRAVIVGSGVRAGSWHGAVKEWVTAHAEALTSRPVAMFTACLTIASDPDKADEVRAYTDPLLAETGITPIDIGLFAGMNEPKAFSLPERLIMKAMKAPQGDFRDYEAVAEWTRGVAERMGL
ncbi:flavodoxin domain-containing protein [Anaerosoma tenue]|uniref:flavodoxin domain-containing protein n=1 Tax=Anaerosoma tenue TaxID=2933588 RepID=UPI002260EEF5|nr:flavodoxin domain-containing protein [Anaerosoma tenue]MCK8115091.1 flavodoxin domain-containing protein [Anaerosoma tenue]